MSLFRRFSQVRRLVASPQKSGAPNLRLFQPCLSCRQTSLSQPCSKLTGVVFHGALWLPRGFASDNGWRDVKSDSQQIECAICTESKLASSCAALLLCSRCLQYELEKNKQSIKCRFLGDSVKFVVLWPPHRSLEHPIYDFSNPAWAAVKLHCLSLAQN